MANLKVTPYASASVDNTKLDFQSLYLRRIISGPNKNQSVVIDGYGNTDFGLTTVNNWGIYDGAADDAKLVARAVGMRMNAGDLSNFFTIIFEIERFKGSTLAVMGATTSDDQGEWAIVGGTGAFAMARGVIRRKVHQNTADGGEVLELTIDAFCYDKTQVPMPTPTLIVPPPIPPRPTPKKNGPWGGRGGTPHDITYLPSRLVSVSHISHRAVNGFYFSYIDQDGQIRDSGLFGNRGFGAPPQTIDLGSTEFVKELSGTYGSYQGTAMTAMWSIKLVTNLRTIGPFGSTYGTPFTFSAPPNNSIVGFFGSSESYSLNAIGAYTVQNSV